ncbi:Positive regulator of sigma(E), RseC/MucC [Candidatus Omnitrophus magneticus]|uniref:Positive regulator of sigma(E), RseC/MucC n=1 Tax=Candidatus Omnitrophus magneticus TaxID=1609969 RepID=A0A0F0CV35_9BACT|nr:Positive regulator of sigma(E), RseC/MucC [Candidatus Omnitrophus magneticus]
MREKGKVVDIKGKYIVLEIPAKSECSKNCCNCHNGKPRQINIIKTNVTGNADNINIGDSMFIEMKSQNFIIICLLLFIFPLVAFSLVLCSSYIILNDPLISFSLGAGIVFLVYIFVGIKMKKSSERFIYVVKN